MNLAYWRTLHFSAADRADPAKEATVWGNHADPDGDHIPNSGEYLLLLNPNVGDNPLNQLSIIQKWGTRWLRIVYTVGADRTVRLNQELVLLADLHDRLLGLFRNHTNHVIFVRGEKTLEFQQIAEVIDIARGVGLDRVALMTQ